MQCQQTFNRWPFALILVAYALYTPALAQQQPDGNKRYVVAYRTEITTRGGKSIGVLEHVTDSNVVVRNDKNGYDYIPIPAISVIRIKFSPKMTTYAFQNFYENYDDLDKNSSGFIDLYSPKNERYLERGLLEEVVGNVFFNTLGALGTRGVNRIRKHTAGTISKFRIKGNPDRYAKLKSEIQLYAVQYQVSPEYDTYLRNALRTPDRE